MRAKLPVALAGLFTALSVIVAAASPASITSKTDWPGVSRTPDEQRFSPLDQVNDKTVAGLGLAWWADIDTDRGVEATPLVVDGVLYNTAPWNVTTAYDAATGRPMRR